MSGRRSAFRSPIAKPTLPVVSKRSLLRKDGAEPDEERATTASASAAPMHANRRVQQRVVGGTRRIESGAASGGFMAAPSCLPDATDPPPALQHARHPY